MKPENTSPQRQQGNKATSDNLRNFIFKNEVLKTSPMFQNPGFIQTNERANKLTSKLPRPMLIAVEGNIVLGIDNNFGSRFVSGILNHFLSPRPQVQGRIPRPTPPLPGGARLRQRRPRLRPRPRLKQEGGQTLPKSSHSRRSRNVSAL